MPVVVVLAVLLLAFLPSLIRGARRVGPGDLPSRVVASAVTRLSAGRRDWGQAMAAELGEVEGRARRWRFAAGTLRVVLFPPPRHGGRVLVTAAAGLTVVAAGTAAAATGLPSLTVFAAVLGLVLYACATAAAARDRWPAPTLPSVLTALVALAGVGGTVADVVAVAVTHPQAAADPTHVYSVLFGLVLPVYLVVPLLHRPGGQPGAAQWRALAATLIAAVAAAVAATASASGGGTWPWLLTVAAVTLAASASTARATRDRAAGARAGMLTVLLVQPALFAIGMTGTLLHHHYVLTNRYDIAHYARSGYHDVASYLLSDALGGYILAGLLIYPCLLLALAHLGATLGAGSRRPAARPALPPTA